MADEQKKYIINIESNYDEYNKQLIEAKKNLEAAQRAQEAMKGGQIKSREEQEKVNTQLRDAQKEYTNAKKSMDLVVQANKAQKGSYEELYKQWQLAQTQLKLMGGAYTTNEKGVRVLSEKYIEQKKVVEEAKKGLDAFGKGVNDNRLNVGNYAGALDMLPGTMKSVITSIKGMTAAAWAFIATPIGAVIAAVAAVVAILVKVFQAFDPVLDKIQQAIAGVMAAMTWLKESVIALITGQERLNESMMDAVKAGIELKKMEQELDDMNWKLIESSAKHKRQIDELLLQSKDRTKSEKERMDLIDEALRIEEQAYNERKAVAEREQEIAQAKIINGRGLTEQEIANIKELGVAYAISLKDKRGITDEEIKNLADANAKIESVLNESINIREKAINRQNVLFEKQEEAAEKRREKAAEAEKKRLEDEIKTNQEILKAREEMEKALEELDNMAFNIWDEADTEQKAVTDEKQKAQWEKEAQAFALNEENKKNILLDSLTSDFEYKTALLQMQYDEEIKAANRIGADTLLIEKKYAQYKIMLARETEESKLNIISGFANALQGIFREQTLISKVAAIAQATISTYLSAQKAYEANAAIPPSPLWSVLAAGSAILSGIATVNKIISVNPDSPTAPTAPTAISSSPVAQRTFAQPTNTNLITAPQLSQQQLNALPTNTLTAAEIAKEIAKLPPPIVTVEAIDNVSNAKKKVEVRATI